MSKYELIAERRALLADGSGPGIKTQARNGRSLLAGSDRTAQPFMRIKALVDIPRHGVKKGQLGGLVAGEFNLSQTGDAWIDKGAIVSDSALVTDDAMVADQARIRGSAIISGAATVNGNAVVTDQAIVRDTAIVTDDARIADKSEVSGSAQVGEFARLHDRSRVTDRAVVNGHVDLQGYAVVGGEQRLHAAPAHAVKNIPSPVDAINIRQSMIDMINMHTRVVDPATGAQGFRPDFQVQASAQELAAVSDSAVKQGRETPGDLSSSAVVSFITMFSEAVSQPAFVRNRQGFFEATGDRVEGQTGIDMLNRRFGPTDNEGLLRQNVPALAADAPLRTLVGRDGRPTTPDAVIAQSLAPMASKSATRILFLDREKLIDAISNLPPAQLETAREALIETSRQNALRLQDRNRLRATIADKQREFAVRAREPWRERYTANYR